MQVMSCPIAPLPMDTKPIPAFRLGAEDPLLSQRTVGHSPVPWIHSSQKHDSQSNSTSSDHNELYSENFVDNYTSDLFFNSVTCPPHAPLRLSSSSQHS